MRTNWRFRALGMVVAVAFAATSIAGCTAPDDHSEAAPVSAQTVAAVPRHGGRLAYGLETDPNGLDPTRNAWDQAGIQLAGALFDPLAAYDAQGEARPYLAESITPNATYTEWTVRLRPGITFHSGEKLTSASLAKHLVKIKGSLITGPPALYIKLPVIEVDELTATVELERPWASFPQLMTGQGGYVASAAQLDSPEGHSRPDGTGPFRLVKWEVDKRFQLGRNENYWREGLPYLDKVDFEVVEDGGKRIAMLQRGDLDVTGLTYFSDLQALDAAMALQDSQEPGGNRLAVQRDTNATDTSSIVFNTTHAPFDDVRIRRAVAYATDLKAVAQANGWPADRLARGPFVPGSPFYAPGDMPGFDLQKAKALVKEYLADTRKTEVSFAFTVTNEPAVAQQLVEQWAKAGIVAKPTTVTRKKAVGLAVSGNYDAMQLRYFASVDPDVLWHFFVKDTVLEQNAISLNFAHFKDDEMDKAFNDGRQSPDPAVRKKAYATVQKRLADQVPYLWTVHMEWRIVSGSRVRDLRNVTLPDGQPALPHMAGTQRLTETWIDA